MLPSIQLNISKYKYCLDAKRSHLSVVLLNRTPSSKDGESVVLPISGQSCTFVVHLNGSLFKVTYSVFKIDKLHSACLTTYLQVRFDYSEVFDQIRG